MTAKVNFENHLQTLHERLNKSVENFHPEDFEWIVKGDISGIQNFIFSVKSDKASKALKGRSYFVQTLSMLGISLLQKELGENNTEVFYNGGGDFFLLSKVPVTSAITKVREQIDIDCKEEEIYLVLTEQSKKGVNFDKVWQSIKIKSGINNLRNFQEDYFAFEPYVHKQRLEDGLWGDKNGYEFEELSSKLKLQPSPLTVGIRPFSGKAVNKNGVSFFKHQISISGNIAVEDYVVGLPKWDERLQKVYRGLIDQRKKEAKKDETVETDKGDIIDFSFLADFANLRTGTDKLGILKLDVDNLGKTFEEIEGWETAKKASTGISWFFGQYMNVMLELPFDSGKFSDNLYVVYSGGDDSFIVGAWDAVFEFADVLRQHFKLFSDEMFPIISKELNFSASLTMVGAKFPVLRFAKAAEAALDDAKKWTDENKCKPKNRVNVFGQVLTWDEYSTSTTSVTAKKLAHTIAEMIRKKESSRSIIERIKRVARDYESLSERAADQSKISGPKVYRLFYSMRKWMKGKGEQENEKSRRAELFEAEIEQFSRDLMESYLKKKKMKYPKYPVAARWAEFLTRKQDSFPD